jgi:hypothetical protein
VWLTSVLKESKRHSKTCFNSRKQPSKMFRGPFNKKTTNYFYPILIEENKKAPP